MKKLTPILLSLIGSLLLFFALIFPVQAGCFPPPDIYVIENLSCKGECEDLVVREGSYPDANYYYRNDANCIFCDNLHLSAEIRANGNLYFSSQTSVQGDQGGANILINGERISYKGLPPSTKAKFWENIYQVKFGEHLFEFQLSSKEEGLLIQNIKCLEGCEKITITTNGADEDSPLEIYNQCPEVKQCKAIFLNYEPGCGGIYENGLGQYFLPEELSEDRNKIMSEWGEVTLDYELVKDPEKIKAHEKRQRQLKRMEKLLIAVAVVILASPLILLIVVIRFVRRKRALKKGKHSKAKNPS